MKFNYMIFKVLGIALVMAVVPNMIFAASVFPTTSRQTVGSHDTFVVNVLLNTEGQNINTVEGVLNITGTAAHVSEISLGGSVLPLWPARPSVKEKNNGSEVTFTGGIPGGLNKADALMFKLVFISSDPGSINIVPAKVTAYKNDGQGSVVETRGQALKVNIVESKQDIKNEWKDQVAADNTPPEDFVVTLGQDPSFFGGKKFISFYTTDSGSGLDHFEVKEGAFTAVRSSSPYVLQEQKKLQPIVIAAYDKAGNVRVVNWQPPKPVAKQVLVVTAWVIIITALILAMKYGYKKAIKKNK